MRAAPCQDSGISPPVTSARGCGPPASGTVSATTQFRRRRLQSSCAEAWRGSVGRQGPTHQLFPASVPQRWKRGRRWVAPPAIKWPGCPSKWVGRGGRWQMNDEPRGVTRRRFLQALGGLGLAGGVSFLVARGIAFRPAAPAVAFRGTAPDGRPYTFGTSGDLVNSNLLMYDRQTDSRWPQLLGQAISGPSRGRVLEQVPLDWTSWGRWRAVHPDTLVLSTRTGYLRQYGNDPYGSYNYGAAHELFGYYEPGQGRFLYFPLLHESDRFDEKEVMVAAELGPHRLAVRKALLRDRGTIQTSLGGRPVAFRYDPALDAGRAYLTGRGGSSKRLVTFDVMWLAWFAFFPRAAVIG